MPHPELMAHNAQFDKKVVELAPGIWTAVGFAASNVHLIEGRTSVTILDTSESTGAAENIKAEFAKLTDKPVGRIVYSHSHRDHISGASVFADDGTPIMAHREFSPDLTGAGNDPSLPQAALGRRTQAQFGIGLSAQERINLGCGPGYRPMRGLGAGFVEPSEWIEANTRIDLDGVEAEIVLAPGETADHLVVWLPESRVLFCGDNWYHAFPNLYAIRGTAYRDFRSWAETLDRLASFNAEVMAPGHTQPVFGRKRVEEVLSTTRDAIRHVMIRTAEAMNAGLSLDDIQASVVLPPELAEKPWLKEFYGKVGWSARAYAVGTLGWYDGNPSHLNAISRLKRAEHMATLAGGVQALWAVAKGTDDQSWRLEVCDHLMALGEDAATLKAETLEALGEVEINATARNTYLWEAKRLRGQG